MNENNAITPSPRNFNLMIVGQIISLFGAALIRFALSQFVLDLTGREDIFATIYAVSNIPIILAPFGGAIADRFNRRNLMVLFDFTSAFIILIYLVILLSGNSSILIIGLMMVLLAFISAIYTPAVTASVPLLVSSDRLESANGLVQAVQALSAVVAPVIGGILYVQVGIRSVVAVSSLAFALSAIMEIFIKIPFFKRESHGGMVKTITNDLKEGFIYVAKVPFILKSMILAALLNFFLAPYFIVGVPIISRITMQASPMQYGVGVGFVQGASIVGALLVGLLTKKTKMNTIYRWILTISVFFVPMTLSVTPGMLSKGFYPSYTLFIASNMPVAVVMTLISIFVLTKVQRVTPNENLGKVMAIITAVAQCVMPIGQVIYGFVFRVFRASMYIPTMVVGVNIILLAFIAWWIMRNEVTK